MVSRLATTAKLVSFDIPPFTDKLQSTHQTKQKELIMQQVVVPESVRRGIVALLLIGVALAYIFFTWRVVGDTRAAPDGEPVEYDDLYSYAAGTIVALIATPTAIAFGQRPPDLPATPDAVTPAPSRPVPISEMATTFRARGNRLGARLVGQGGGSKSVVAKSFGTIYPLLWIAGGAYSLVVWFGNRNEASSAHHSMATAFTGIALGAITYALRGASSESE